MRAWPGLLLHHGEPRCRLNRERIACVARNRSQDAEGEWQPAAGQMGRHRAVGTGTRLQGAPRLDHVDLRCGGRRDRPDRNQGRPAGRRAGLTAIGHSALCAPPEDLIDFRYFFAGLAAARPPVGTAASAVLVDTGVASRAPATKRSCTAFGVSSATGAPVISICGSTSATTSV